jgi:anti-sigma factor RsiW
MSDSQHERAARMIFRSQLEDLDEADSNWLEAHLADCAECSVRAASMRRSILAIRSATVQVDPAMVQVTRLRVRRRALERERRSLAGTWLWLVTALSLAWIAAVADVTWRGFGWAAHQIGVPSPFWQMGFAIWWVVPPLLLAAMFAGRCLAVPSPIEE